MPAVLSRTHAPRRTTPVASSCTGVRVAWAVVPSRMYSMSRGDVPFCWAISLTSATRSMACPPMRRRTSPGCSPQSRAGQTPFFTADNQYAVRPHGNAERLPAGNQPLLRADFHLHAAKWDAEDAQQQLRRAAFLPGYADVLAERLVLRRADL